MVNVGVKQQAKIFEGGESAVDGAEAQTGYVSGCFLGRDRRRSLDEYFKQPSAIRSDPVPARSKAFDQIIEHVRVSFRQTHTCLRNVGLLTPNVTF